MRNLYKTINILKFAIIIQSTPFNRDKSPGSSCPNFPSRKRFCRLIGTTNFEFNYSQNLTNDLIFHFHNSAVYRNFIYNFCRACHESLK